MTYICMVVVLISTLLCFISLLTGREIITRENPNKNTEIIQLGNQLIYHLCKTENTKMRGKVEPTNHIGCHSNLEQGGFEGKRLFRWVNLSADELYMWGLWVQSWTRLGLASNLWLCQFSTHNSSGPTVGCDQVTHFNAAGGFIAFFHGLTARFCANSTLYLALH